MITFLVIIRQCLVAGGSSLPTNPQSLLHLQLGMHLPSPDNRMLWLPSIDLMPLGEPRSHPTLPDSAADVASQ